MGSNVSASTLVQSFIASQLCDAAAQRQRPFAARPSAGPNQPVRGMNP